MNFRVFLVQSNKKDRTDRPSVTRSVGVMTDKQLLYRIQYTNSWQQTKMTFV